MTIDEAKKVIEKFHYSITDLRPNAIVQDISKLRNSLASIKYAHFVYGEQFIKDGLYIEAKQKMTNEEKMASFTKVSLELMESYGLIGSLFSEDAENINKQYVEYIKGLKNGIITEFRMPNPFGDMVAVNEFLNFLGECWFITHRTKIFNDALLSAEIYEGVVNKAIKDNDIKTLRELADSNLTRAVFYPGKK